MKFYLVIQPEIAYIKDKKHNIVRKIYAPSGYLFVPAYFEFDQFPKNYQIGSLNHNDFREFINQIKNDSGDDLGEDLEAI